MANDRLGPQVFTVPVYRSFADAIAAGLIARHGREPAGLARGLIIAPNNRAARSLTDAFVRSADKALLLPRIVAIGDAGDMPGAMLDPIDADVPPAVDPMTRRMILARLIQQERAAARAPVTGAESLRLAGELATTLDELLAEEVSPSALIDLAVAPELASHWQASLALFASIVDRWPPELAALGRIDLTERRNRLLRALAKSWRDAPPAHFVVAAGVTSAAPAIAALLRVVARLPQGRVVLPGLDLVSPDEEWDAIAGIGDDGRDGRAIETHPQHHLRLLLDRMGVARAEVTRWRQGDGRTRRALRARVVSNAFAPARFTSKWRGLPAEQRRLNNVRLAEFPTLAGEAQGIAIAVREAVETPGRTVALVTPDRALAARVSAHLRRWGIEADDSAGQPLSATPPGVLIQAVATLGAEAFAPAALLAVLKHPLVAAGDTRVAWLDGVRRLDLALRGPRPAPGLDGLRTWLAGGDARERRARGRAEGWWHEQSDRFRPLEAAYVGRPTLPDLLVTIRETAEALAGERLWTGPAGRALAELFDALALDAPRGPLDVAAADVPAILRQLMGEVAVRPPQGGHPRVAILGLIEARLQQADLIILGGMNEGSWPGATAADPWLSPRVRHELGLADPERRVGLAAHDLALGLGGGEVLITRARRDARSATVPSRFLLRLNAMTGGLSAERRLPALAEAIDANTGDAQPVDRPAPRPPVAERPRRISVTEVDRLKADPYAFYARSMLRLSALDAVDAEPGPAWRGSAVHDVLERWMKEDDLAPDALIARVEALLAADGTHPIVRALWQPRLIEAIDWVGRRVVEDLGNDRRPLASEVAGSATIAGVELVGRADRIDRLPGGGLAIVDYKTGKPPTTKAVGAGYSMQLGLLGAIAEQGGFRDIDGLVAAFEYWTLTRDGDRGFGAVKTPVGGRGGIASEEFVDRASGVFADAARRWLTGDDAFTAKLAPDYAPYEEYDQLMRRDEWYGRGD